MREMSIDIETYSSVDLTKSGVYAYVNAPDFEILLFSYAFDSEEVKIIDLAKEKEIPAFILEALTDENIVKTAYNANFERTCIQKYLNIKLPIEQWRCSAVSAAQLGLPPTLEGVAKVLGLKEQKDLRGKALIRYFCMPCTPTKINGGRTRNLPNHAPEKWEDFKSYCIQDVEVERAIKNKIAKFPVKESEWELWRYDQRINDRGVKIDIKFVENAIKFLDIHKSNCIKRAKEITNLDNLNSVSQLKNWIGIQIGEEIKSLDKESVKMLIDNTENPKIKEMLTLRQQMSKSSTAKYLAMLESVCPDERIRGMLQFYGANRTGRWAGRIVQLHNLPQNHMKDLAYARKCVKEGDYEWFEMIYDNVPQVLSELIRTAFIPDKGNKFIVADFSAIEARVIAYLADEKWRLEVFKTHGKIYEASAAQMFHVPVESIKKGDILRQKGKIAELALGYGGGKGALTSMGALKMGLSKEELPILVSKWRESNKNITSFWREVEKAAKNAINNKPSKIRHNIAFIKQSGILFIELPSKRRLAYISPKIEQNTLGFDSITYMGMNQTSKQWERQETFGGKLVENIVQAVARDCLAESIKKIEERGYEINFHVHDEVIVNTSKGTVEEITSIMSEPIEWANGLPLKADGYECDFYKKD